MAPGVPPIDLLQDRALLNGFKAGDPRALETVYRTYAPLVARMLRMGLHVAQGRRVSLLNPEDVEDLLQEVFYKLLRPAGRQLYDAQRPFLAFVRTVTRSALLDHLRKQRRHLAEPLPDDQQLEAALLLASDGRAVLDADEAVRVQQFLETCTPAERSLLRLRFDACTSQRDAAHALGMSRQQVRTLETQIRERFSASFTTQFPTPPKQD